MSVVRVGKTASGRVLLGALVLASAGALAQQRPDAGTTLETIKEPRVPPRPEPRLDLPAPAKPAMREDTCHYKSLYPADSGVYMFQVVYNCK